MPTRSIREVIRNQTILTAPGNISVHEASRRMKTSRVGAVMVVDDDKLKGIFTERDALYRVIAEGLDPNTTPVADVMTCSPTTTTPDRPLGHALHVMFDGGFRHVPIIDDDGRPIGMISARDALGLEMVAFENELDQRETLTERL